MHVNFTGVNKSVKQKSTKPAAVKAAKIKTNAVEFDKGELGHNNGPVIVPSISSKGRAC